MPKRFRTAGALALAAALGAGCAGPTPYQPAGEGMFGYAARPVGFDRWRVSFSGNSATPRATVEDYLLHRAAEIALEKGAARFRVTSRDVEPITRFRGAGFATGGGLGTRSSAWGVATLPAEAQPVTRYAAFLEILLLGDTAPTDPDVHIARDVLAAIGPRVHRPRAD